MRKSTRNLLVACSFVGLTFQSAVYAQDSRSQLSDLWSRLGSIYADLNSLRSNDATEVEAMIKSAIKRSSELYGSDSEEVVQTTFDLCKLYRMQARYGDMRPYLKSLNETYPSLSGSGQARFAPTYLDFANELIQYDRAREGKILYQPVLECMKTSVKQADVQGLAEKLSNISHSLRNRHDNEGLESMLRAQLLIEERRRPADNARIADARSHLAEFLKDTDNMASAKELAFLALEGQEKAYGVGDRRTLNTLILAALLYFNDNNAQEAGRLMPRIDAALKQSSFTDRAQLSKITPLMAKFAQAGDVKSVHLLFDRALDVADRYSYSQFDNSLREISEALTASGQIAEAESLYRKLLAWTEVQGSVADVNYRAQVLLMTVRFYATTRQNDKLDSTLILLAEADKHTRGDQMRSAISYIEQSNNLASTTKAYELLITAMQDNSEPRQFSYYVSTLIRHYLDQGNTKAALLKCDLLCKMMRDHLPVADKDLADECKSLLTHFVETKKYSEAQSLCSSMNCGFDNNRLTSVANGYTVVSRCRSSIGQYDRALQLVQSALSSAEKYGNGKDNHSYLDAMSQYVSILRATGKSKEATQHEQEANQIREAMRRG